VKQSQLSALYFFQYLSAE